MEREFTDYEDWLRAGGQEGTGQKLENPELGPSFSPLVVTPNAFAGPSSGPPPPVAPTTGGGGGKTPAQIEAEGRAYDQEHGLVGGYMMNGQWVNGSPYGGGGGGGNTFAAGGGGFDYGRPMFNTFTPYTPFNFQRYSPQTFAPTDRTMLFDENVNPGFKRSQDRLMKQIEAGAAYQGVLRSGNTFDRLGSILGNNEEAQFKAFDDRRFRDFTMNEGNRFNAWNTNTGYAERDNQRMNDFRFNTEKATADDLLSRWAELVRSTTTLARPS